ncbi:hypothetical protein ACLVWU_02765 [Bdellovibrio sp. HCB290]|uniref:hypothetical protein n=1 Tax=Bdellovibrio sp. HCB290 TaxID=3394356 RepID=UPI0039B66B46
MKLKDNKLEIAILVVAAVLVGGLGNLFKAPVQKAIQNGDISFEMIRPKSVLAALFDLGGREVSRNYVNPFGNKKAEEKATTPNTEDKTKQAAAAKTAAKKAEEKKADADKKPETTINVVGAEATFKAGTDDLDSGASAGAGVAQNGAAGGADKSKTDGDKKSMTADQWRSLVLGQPTKENVNKMVVAYMDQELTDGEFYGIVKELLQNSNPETQSLGLSAASSFYTAPAFNVVASSYKNFGTDMQAKAMAYMLGFANAGRLGALASSLKSSDVDVVNLAAQIVVKGYNSAKEGTATSQGNRYRGDAFVNALGNYTQFVQVFKDLAQNSQNSEIAGIATSALSQIQSGVATL